jgi:hypothetical protein
MTDNKGRDAFLNVNIVKRCLDMLVPGPRWRSYERSLSVSQSVGCFMVVSGPQYPLALKTCREVGFELPRTLRCNKTWEISRAFVRIPLVHCQSLLRIQISESSNLRLHFVSLESSILSTKISRVSAWEYFGLESETVYFSQSFVQCGVCRPLSQSSLST